MGSYLLIEQWWIQRLKKNLFFISLMAIMGGAVSFFIVMLARRLREYRTILSANHQCEDNTNRHEENETVTTTWKAMIGFFQIEK